MYRHIQYMYILSIAFLSGHMLCVVELGIVKKTNKTAYDQQRGHLLCLPS